MTEYDEVIRRALEEDIGTGDITTSSLIDPRLKGIAEIRAKEDLILAGITVARRVFKILNPETQFEESFNDGDMISDSTVIAKITGRAMDLLMGERVALNFLQRLSGIATLTHRFVERVKGYPVKIIDTRKTTPVLRKLEKDAVKAGGGFNHRFGLFDGVLIKDNHIVACGSIFEAIRKAREGTPHTLKIEVEVRDLEGVKEALNAKVDAVLLDNMDIETMRKAVKIIDGKMIVEASGGITLHNVEEIAKTGVDLISIGALTHSARAVDIDMDLINTWI
ncbi:MAG TPA: carboxylating nicotinate-nucleotide diphosphorylase [Syntrophaceae bacterium]|nr:carboxylating nicotinate-nucleotide diphosphorylase [Syntrophaceae bacterium]